MICASLAPKSLEEAAALLRRAKEEGADIAELRVDLMPPDADLPAILAAKPLPVIVTVRPTWEGGRFDGTEDKRLMILQQAGNRGADYIDIEYKAYKDLQDVETKIIVSFHDHEGMPEDLAGLVRKMELLRPSIVKLAATPRTAAQTVALARESAGRECLRSTIGMGEWGEALRILTGKLGGAMTYAALDPDVTTAPGQLTVRELRDLYRAHEIDLDTRVFGVIGNPVRHSRGPLIWNRAFSRLGMRAVYVRLPVDDVSVLRDLIDVLQIEGLSVTVPHKEGVLGLLDRVDPAAERIGAVNTVKVTEGKLSGSNTDGSAAISVLREGCRRRFGTEALKGSRVLLFGAGGAARAILVGLVEAGAEVVVVNRSADRADALAREFGAEALVLDRVGTVRDARIVVNATTVGMSPEEGRSIVPERILRADQVCFDAVYTPRETRFLKQAREAGAETCDGLGMFLKQAAAQFETLVGDPLPEEVLHAWEELLTSTGRP
jgi:3-dehydroquinate dehydratase/shikimate dehydrogenase